MYICLADNNDFSFQGQPHYTYFPYDTLEGAVAHPSRLPLPTDKEKKDKKKEKNADDGRLIVPKTSEEETSPQRKIDLMTALQYGSSDGYPALRSFMRDFVRNHQHPDIPYAGGPEVIMTCGATDGFSKTIETFTNVWDPQKDWIREREGVLCEQFTYMNAVQTARPRGLNVVSVAIDSEGMLASGPGGLADVLGKWDFSKGRRPHLMYTITYVFSPAPLCNCFAMLTRS